MQFDFRVLDMGCGIGGSAFFLAKEINNVGSVLGVDISENMLNVSVVKNKYVYVIMGMMATTFLDRSNTL